jgi:hypothetical protein
VLIALGTVFLLNNLGVLDWGVWSLILRLWPVLLIGIGLDLLVGRRSVWGSLLVVLVMLGILAGAIWYYGVQPAGGRLLEGERLCQPLQGAQQADVTIEFGAGSLTMEALEASSQNLVEGTARLWRGERVAEDFSVQQGVAEYRLRTVGFEPLIIFGPWDEGHNWDLAFNASVPIELTARMGVGQATLDLSDLSLEGLDVGLGVGQANITLPSEGVWSVSIRTGVGETIVRIPQGVAARIHARGGLVSISVDAAYPRQGEVYVSPDYETAENRVEVEVNGGIGSIRVVQIP